MIKKTNDIAARKLAKPGISLQWVLVFLIIKKIPSILAFTEYSSKLLVLAISTRRYMPVIATETRTSCDPEGEEKP